MSAKPRLGFSIARRSGRSTPIRPRTADTSWTLCEKDVGPADWTRLIVCVDCAMIKSLSILAIVSFVCVCNLLGQSEPQKPPPFGAASAAPGVHEPGKPPIEKNPPPPFETSPAAKGEKSAKASTETSTRPIIPADMDTSVKPSDDFFLYANGGWIKRTEIPPEYPRWGSFNELIEKNNDVLHEIAEKAAKTKADPKTAPEVQKVGDYYASGMDEKTIDAMRTKPLHDGLGKIAR